ncbi:MAG: ABC transporter permease, partial [Thermoguttaceae bacterium]
MMNILIIIRVALRALAKNKMRAALTVLGIVIGVWAVILLVSISQSAGNKVRTEIMSLGGTNVIYVFH